MEVAQKNVACALFTYSLLQKLDAKNELDILKPSCHIYCIGVHF